MSCAGIQGTEVLLRDIPGKNGIVGSYVVGSSGACVQIGSVWSPGAL